MLPAGIRFCARNSIDKQFVYGMHSDTPRVMHMSRWSWKHYFWPTTMKISCFYSPGNNCANRIDRFVEVFAVALFGTLSRQDHPHRSERGYVHSVTPWVGWLPGVVSKSTRSAERSRGAQKLRRALLKFLFGNKTAVLGHEDKCEKDCMQYENKLHFEYFQ